MHTSTALPTRICLYNNIQIRTVQGIIVYCLHFTKYNVSWNRRITKRVICVIHNIYICDGDTWRNQNNAHYLPHTRYELWSSCQNVWVGRGPWVAQPLFVVLRPSAALGEINCCYSNDICGRLVEPRGTHVVVWQQFSHIQAKDNIHVTSYK